MHSLLTKLLNKRGIGDVNQLDEEERTDFDNWNRVLSKEELTLGDIKVFCQSQIEIIEGKWRDYNIENIKKSEWIPYHTVYKAILQAVDSPKVVREQLERQLNELLK